MVITFLLLGCKISVSEQSEQNGSSQCDLSILYRDVKKMMGTRSIAPLSLNQQTHLAKYLKKNFKQLLEHERFIDFFSLNIFSNDPIKEDLIKFLWIKNRRSLEKSIPRERFVADFQEITEILAAENNTSLLYQLTPESVLSGRTSAKSSLASFQSYFSIKRAMRAFLPEALFESSIPEQKSIHFKSNKVLKDKAGPSNSKPNIPKTTTAQFKIKRDAIYQLDLFYDGVTTKNPEELLGIVFHLKKEILRLADSGHLGLAHRLTLSTLVMMIQNPNSTGRLVTKFLNSSTIKNLFATTNVLKIFLKHSPRFGAELEKIYLSLGQGRQSLSKKIEFGSYEQEIVRFWLNYPSTPIASLRSHIKANPRLVSESYLLETFVLLGNHWSVMKGETLADFSSLLNTYEQLSHKSIFSDQGIGGLGRVTTQTVGYLEYKNMKVKVKEES